MGRDFHNNKIVTSTKNPCTGCGNLMVPEWAMLIVEQITMFISQEKTLNKLSS